MTDLDFWLQVRRAVLMIAHAIEKRYNSAWLLVLLTGEKNKT